MQMFKRKTLRQILVDQDQTCSIEKVEKLIKFVSEINKALGIEDDKNNVVELMMKIESRIN